MTRERLVDWPRPRVKHPFPSLADRACNWHDATNDRYHDGSKMAIDEREEIRLGNTTQWIRVRGADVSNPVLLLIQQGPGLPMMNEARRIEHLLGLEKDFTVVYWDQRGCGRSLRNQTHQANISVERMVDDTVSLLELLHERFDEKIYVAGFSFG